METPSKIDYGRLKQAISKEDVVPTRGAGLRVVSDKDLIKVGGLYRIRDNYEPVWRMETEEDGKRYISRADEAGSGTPERLRVESDANPADHTKAATTITGKCAECGREGTEKNPAKHADGCSEEPERFRKQREEKEAAVDEPLAYKVVHAGAVYVAWECESCATPNLTKYGNQYECDECHKRYADVLRTEQPRKAVLTRDEVVAEFGDSFGKRMATLGIRLAHRSLLDVWTREAEKAVNPWAVCHESVGPEKSEKFERCVKDVKKKSPIKKD
jgi:hypothetical protein